MKKVCYINGSGGNKDYNVRLSGPRRMAHELSKRLKDDYELFSLKLGNKNHSNKNEFVIKNGLLAPFRLFKTIWKINPHIIHGYGSLNMGLVLSVLKIGFNKKTILTFTDFKKNVTNSYKIINLMDKVIVQTKYAKKKLLRKGVNKKIIQQIIYGVESEFSKGKVCPEIRRLSKKIVLYYGDARWERGFNTLLDAIELASKDVFFLICVRSTYNNINHKKKNSIKNKENVCLMTMKEYPCPIEDIVASCDLVVLPFIKNTLEPPLTLMEVATIGKPLIITDVGGNKEIIPKEGRMVLDKITPECLTNEIKSFFKQKRKKVKKKSFPWNKTITEIKMIYSK